MLVFEGQALRFAREQKERAWLAWHAATLLHWKKMPDLKTFVERQGGKPPRLRPAQRQTSEQQWAAFGAIAAASRAMRRH